MSKLDRKPYSGSTCQLGLAIDIGTSWSGISFCLLQPGNIPESHGVLRYPGLGLAGQSGDGVKVPSVMYYDSKGNFKAAGYEVFNDEVIELAMMEEWVKLEWWKLHLRPKHISCEHIKDDDIPPLPNGKSIIDVLTDFIRYLFRCAEMYIKEFHSEDVWQSVKNTIQFIFTHPNGWEDARQQLIQPAIELAGLVPATPDGRARVTFLSEGEAGLHFCISDLFTSGVPDQEKHSRGQGVVVIDAGSGTIDLSAYSIKSNPTSFEEIAQAKCRLQGSIFVSRRAKGLLQEKLQGSRYGSPDAINEITEMFDRTTKLDICDAEHPTYIKFGSLCENDVDHNIKFGKLKLSGEEATQLFDQSIQAIIDAFEEQRCTVDISITMAFLIGGFSANNWLWSQLDAYFKSHSIKLSRPSRVHKAVPDGALSYLIDRLVSSQTARATHNAACSKQGTEEDPGYFSKTKDWFMCASGLLNVPPAVQRVLYNVIKAHILREFRYRFGCMASKFGVTDLSILCYQGALPDLQWIDYDRGSLSTLCTVRFDLCDAATTLVSRTNSGNQPGMFNIEVNVTILFGVTKFSAQVALQLNDKK